MTQTIFQIKIILIKKWRGFCLLFHVAKTNKNWKQIHRHGRRAETEKLVISIITIIDFNKNLFAFRRLCLLHFQLCAIRIFHRVAVYSTLFFFLRRFHHFQLTDSKWFQSKFISYQFCSRPVVTSFHVVPSPLLWLRNFILFFLFLAPSSFDVIKITVQFESSQKRKEKSYINDEKT